jgi:hypothetical protein
MFVDYQSPGLRRYKYPLGWLVRGTQALGYYEPIPVSPLRYEEMGSAQHIGDNLTRWV